jgi:hypothetical protein
MSLESLHAERAQTMYAESRTRLGTLHTMAESSSELQDSVQPFRGNAASAALLTMVSALQT